MDDEYAPVRARPAAPKPPKKYDPNKLETVVLELEIERDGTVGSVSVREGPTPFADVARASAKEWRFSPATRNGLPIRARVLAKVLFHPPEPIARVRDTNPASEVPASGAASREPSSAPKPPPTVGTLTHR